MSENWKGKHDGIIKNKKNILKAYNENIPIKEIARVYKVSTSCISNNLKLWGAIKKYGIRYLLKKMILEGESN